jgi:hypothetical protein
VNPTRYYTAQGRASPLHSAHFVDGPMMLPLLLVCAALWGWLAARRRAHAGAALVGTVEDGDATPAIAITIEQRGREWNGRYGWQHEWREVKREVRVRPFWVRRADGEAVLVEPDEGVFLVDKLDGIEQLDYAVRIRRATLTHGEPVHIVGTLIENRDPEAGAYRGGGARFRLLPPRGGRMMVSTEPLDARHRRRARVHAWLGLGAAALLAFLQCLAYGSFNLLRIDGEPVDGEVRTLSHSQKWHCPKHGSCHYDHYYYVLAQFTDERGTHALYDGIAANAYERLADDSDPRVVPFVVSHHFPSLHQIGHAPTIARAWEPLLFLLVLLALCAHPAILVATRPWYDRKLVIDRARGRL